MTQLIKVQFPGDPELPQFTDGQVEEIAYGLMVFAPEKSGPVIRALAIALARAKGMKV